MTSKFHIENPAWNEKRIDVIGQNGNDGEHYTVDPGEHYRKKFRVKLTDEDIQRGYVVIQVDPFRIARIYNMVCPALFTVLKKILRAGTGGHKAIDQDIDDVENAIGRLKQLNDEDRANGW